MTPEAVDLLLVCCEGGRWHVTADNLIDVAELARHQYVSLEDDYEIIVIRITDKGRKYAIKKGWLASAPDSAYEPWRRTAAGQQASNFITQRA